MADLLQVRVQPNARRNEIVGLHGESLKIKIAAVPEDGKANTELCDFIAECLGLAKSKVSVMKGQSSRQKAVAIEGLSASEAREKLLAIRRS